MTITEITPERHDVAMNAYIPLMGVNSELCEKIRDHQWEMVGAGKADMDCAFVLAVEELVINV